ncbi:hypothetical protein M5X11_12295 [Paenibacillus alginolyticus]|uniref:hypothetical protein n=1 Tax=Paenibacillus alginolyticus TaxID=59839 RepID=UPI00040451D6|nr:hypothetical protein [Paenibacillus alginolyticus]MCY9665735.1 hypothetical protein [Paenibacillus alginolyticus]
MDKEFTINAARTAMISDLLEAYKRLHQAGVEREENLEKLMLTYSPVDGLSIAGAIDVIRVRGYAYESVELGKGFEKSIHFPRELLIRFGLIDNAH